MIVIQGGTVLTVDDAGTVHFPGHVVIDGDRIAAVGGGAYPGEVPAGAEVIDASGMVVMPGMVDLHYHTAIGKGFCDHLPLLESLEQFWYPSIRALDPETAYWAALSSYARVDQVRRDHGQRHVPPARRAGPGRRGDRHPGRAVQRRGPARARAGHAAGQPGLLRRRARPG